MKKVQKPEGPAALSCKTVGKNPEKLFNLGAGSGLPEKLGETASRPFPNSEYARH